MTKPQHALRTVALVVLTLLLLRSTVLVAQDSATVTFSLDFPHSEPEHYLITVNSSGHAKYECSARVSQYSDERENYQVEFELTPATRARIFELTSQARFFSGKVDSGNTKLAFTGSKKLTYQDGKRNNVAEYNYSPVVPIQQLTSVFQGLAATLDYGRRLAYSHRYQKLALDEELKGLEIQARNNEVSELQAIHEVLEKIVGDSSVMNVVRARAQRLLAMGKADVPSR